MSSLNLSQLLTSDFNDVFTLTKHKDGFFLINLLKLNCLLIIVLITILRIWVS